MSQTADVVTEASVERLLSSLAGVVSVRAVASPDGGLQEIHVLSAPGVHPKQVVRNVESALCAGLGLEVDRRIVSVAQMRDAEYAEAVQTEPGLAPAPSPQPEPAERLVLVRYDARTHATGEAFCRVVLRQGEQEFTGSGEGPNTQQGRVEAAARALFSAVVAARSSEDLALEDATIVEALGRRIVLVAANGIVGRQHVPLTGAALITRSPEEAAILAALQATNRWASLPS